jgi:hypothetical protein
MIAAIVVVIMTVQAVAGPVVTVKIRIGKNSEECSKFGICWKDSGVSVDFALVANGTEDGTTLQINENTGNLDVTFPPSVWKEKATYFGGNTVLFEEEVSLGKKISNLLKSPSDITIKPGKYSIKKDRSNNIIVSIPVK